MKVRFTRDDTPYRAGEVHTFKAAAAEKLIRHGVAEPTKTGAVKPEPDEPEDEEQEELDLGIGT